VRHASAIPELAELLCRYTGADEKRGNVVMIRVSDDAVAHLDRLVEAGLFGSRSEAAAFLIGTGIDANEEILSHAARHSAEIKKIRTRLGDAIVKSLKKRRK
jgi:Arc/MetJ-type ribon-helix-helix transcriptional regulator